MTYEQMKSAVLTFLVLLSVILTWQLWTFQPEYSLLEEEPEYIESDPIGEEKAVAEVIQPEQMVLHNGSDDYIVTHEDALFTELYNVLLSSEIDGVFTPANEGLQSLLAIEHGVEVVYPTSVVNDVFLRKLTVDADDFHMPLEEVDRVLLFTTSDSDYVHIRFVSESGQRIVQAFTNYPSGEFEDHFLSQTNELPKAVSYPAHITNEGFSVQHYLPEETLAFDRLSYTSTLTSATDFRQILFSDPNYVKFYRQEDGDQVFTDGNRMMTISGDRNFMDYIHPVFTDNQEPGSTDIVSRAYEFINGHSGWTDMYLLYDWTSSSVRDEALFRMNVSGLPVFAVEGEDRAYIYVSQSGIQISRYVRPLFDLDAEPINAREQVILPSGQEVLTYLESEGYLERQRRPEVKVGYELTKENAIITLEPHWFIGYNGHWEKISFGDRNDLEDERDGLE
ncbi:YycH family regulatory protein [Desertibacillus haloalkaliphilus]|uniref:YycH family regulatory protein n=1 Tax=Desertibacillus haloalkaliphilus TaxID=1328930 RepID=UPI001C252972|nr:two-component system activity regulator YycH [Desertibacillus haloalkaliphilus]MBU8905785.1 hypothetical protein [Desertibacillus haloalkaliphilus]